MPLVSFPKAQADGSSMPLLLLGKEATARADEIAFYSIPDGWTALSIEQSEFIVNAYLSCIRSNTHFIIIRVFDARKKIDVKQNTSRACRIVCLTRNIIHQFLHFTILFAQFLTNKSVKYLFIAYFNFVNSLTDRFEFVTTLLLKHWNTKCLWNLRDY